MLLLEPVPELFFSYLDLYGRKIMTTKLTHPVTNITTYLPLLRPMNPGHDVSENPDPPVLDLCVRKHSVSPDYPHDYKDSKHSPYSSPRSPSELSEVSSSNSPTHKLKPSRPFKVYPNNPLSISFMSTSADTPIMDSVGSYAEFRKKVLTQVQATHSGTNKNMRRTQSQNHQITDPTYWEKRKKNNEAAKRSRDARKAKEDEIAVRCAYLEQQNLQLQIRIATLEESLRLKSMNWQR